MYKDTQDIFDQEENLITADRVARERTEIMREIEYDLDILTTYQLKQVRSHIKARYHI